MNKYSEILKKIINKFNFKIEHKNSWYKRNEHFIAEINDDELKIIKQISNYSMSTPANHWAIIQSIKHISQNNIEGDIVESGVWKGGNLICSLNDLISSIPRLDAPSISITSKDLASAISMASLLFGLKSAEGLSAEFNAIAKILAVVVFPTPLGPVNRYA